MIKPNYFLTSRPLLALRKSIALDESVGVGVVSTKLSNIHSWRSETGNTTKSESIDIKEECLVEETSFDYGENSALANIDPNQMPKTLNKPLGIINYAAGSGDDDVLNESALFPPPLPIKPSVQISVHKSFALDIDLISIAGKSSQEKLGLIRKVFSDVNGFGGASTSSKFGGIIHATFTSEKAMMATANLANDHGIVVNTDLKHPVNNHTNQAIVLKEILVGTSVETKAIIKLEDQDQADLLASKWFILIEKDAMQMARADIDKQLWNVKDNFIGSIGGKTCFIDCNPASYSHACCATVCFSSEMELVNAITATPVIKGTWASVVGAPFTLSLSNHGLCADSIGNSKLFPSIMIELEKCLVNIKSSLISFAGQISELAIRLNSFVPAVSQLSPGCQLPVTFPSQNQGENIVMRMGLGGTTGDETATVAVVDPSASLHVISRWCIFTNLFSMSKLIWKVATCNVHGMNNLAKQDDIVCWHKETNNLISIFTETKLKEKICLWIANKFESVWVFTFGLDSGYLGVGVAIVIDAFLACYVCKVFEVSGRLLSIKLLFKNKLSVSVLGLYTGVSSNVQFSQTGDINSLVAKTVNESSFVILGSDFNENSTYKCASFRRCFDLGLVNSLGGSLLAKTPTWNNSCGVAKIIDYVFVSSNLINAVVDRGMTGVKDFFDTDHKAVSVSMGLEGLLNVQLNLKHKQANRDHWKFDVSNVSSAKWHKFTDSIAANTVLFSDTFSLAWKFSDLDAM
ncbi:hypothetical protein G9A89_015121 [Geosiphon pyriformis]|nr:hypothetical protein G9A89_015121 [Geosiphon pyriformis]